MEVAESRSRDAEININPFDSILFGFAKYISGEPIFDGDKPNLSLRMLGSMRKRYGFTDTSEMLR